MMKSISSVIKVLLLLNKPKKKENQKKLKLIWVMQELYGQTVLTLSLLQEMLNLLHNQLLLQNLKTYRFNICK